MAALRRRAGPATVWRPASRRKAARRTRGRRSSGGVAREEEEGTWGRAARARAVAGDGEDEDARRTWAAWRRCARQWRPPDMSRSEPPTGVAGIYTPPPFLSRLVAKTGTKGEGAFVPVLATNQDKRGGANPWEEPHPTAPGLLIQRPGAQSVDGAPPGHFFSVFLFCFFSVFLFYCFFSVFLFYCFFSNVFSSVFS